MSLPTLALLPAAMEGDWRIVFGLTCLNGFGYMRMALHYRNSLAFHLAIASAAWLLALCRCIGE